VTILGGEPLLNPTILDWIDGINDLWNVPVQILTNGTRLNRVAGLYDRVVNAVDPDRLGIKNWIGVSLHNQHDRERCFDEVKKFLHGDINYYHHTDPLNVNNAMTFGATHAFVDSNNVRIPIWEYDSFYKAAVHLNQDGKFTLYNNIQTRHTAPVDLRCSSAITSYAVLCTSVDRWHCFLNLMFNIIWISLTKTENY
jgi:hypothetical protein